MSNLVVEVCRVEKVEPHPNADRMKIATVKGWKTAIKYDPATDKAQFQVGDLCIYFPPDSILPPQLANAPDDEIPGRLNIAKYLKSLPKQDGQRPQGGRVAAARLRGQPSYGVIMELDPRFGDDPNWAVGTDVADHFGITKWEPPLEATDGDAERAHTNFPTFASPEHYGNYPLLLDGEEVVFTEKIHGKNARLGLVLAENEAGEPTWTFMAGSHGVRRKEFMPQFRRFPADELPSIDPATVAVGQVFSTQNRTWQVDEVRQSEDKRTGETRVYLRAMLLGSEGQPQMVRSEFWCMMTEEVKSFLQYVRDEFPWPEPKVSIVLFGELFGSGVQDMAYGQKAKSFRAFDVTINGQYLDFDDKTRLLSAHGIEQVPILYRGPFSLELMEQYTNGPTTLCDSSSAGSFKGREGIVMLPVHERFCSPLGKRLCLKSISADYLARSGGTDSR